MTLQQLKERQQTLLNLIANVGGKNNIRKWVDELMSVEAKIEELESPQIIVKYDDSDYNHTTPWVVIIGGRTEQRFPTRAKCDRFLVWKGLMAA